MSRHRHGDNVFADLDFSEGVFFLVDDGESWIQEDEVFVLGLACERIEQDAAERRFGAG